MIRQAPRLLLRSSLPLRTTPTRRLVSSAPPAQKSRSWKSYAARLGLAAGAVYYYNTSEVFAEEPPFSIPPPQSPTEETSLQTLESIATKNRTPPPPTPLLASTQPSQGAPPPSSENAAPDPMPSVNEGLEATEEEAHQEGAFNEETGEINWDCPCLGGMAHGPCGEQFREAFSCFVYSKDEPKGMDCIPNFKNMQDCFREHPDVYGVELEDDEEGAESEDAPAPVSVDGGEVPAAAISAPFEPAPAQPSPSPSTSSPTMGGDTQRAFSRSADEGDELVPKAAHDATGANVGK